MANYLTQDDVQNYGSDLVDFAQRAAVQAVAPHLQHLDQQAGELQRRLAVEARHRLDAEVEAAIPNYRDIDRDPNWHQFLLERDALSGQIRQQLLNEAIAAADARRVIAFFHGFERSSASQQPATPQHRASPSRASSRPTPNGTIYTRAQISKLYEQHRRGAYVGREAEWAKLEFDIIRAGAEGRIAGGVDLHGK